MLALVPILGDQMRRTFAISGLCVIALAGCDRPGSSMRQPMELQDIRAPADSENQQFSIYNFWSMTMNRDAIAPRFERARAKCIIDRTLNCKLLNTHINLANGLRYSSSSASLDMLLPHDRVDGFKKDVLQPLEREKNGDVSLQSSSTRAENVETEGADANRKVAGLTGYRDTLIGLRKKSNLSIDDIIKLEAEISRVQEELDDALKTKALVDSRLARESVFIELNERPQGAIAAVWNRGADIFVQSVADALDFLIRIIPWLPIVAAAIAFMTWIVRLLWRRKPQT